MIFSSWLFAAFFLVVFTAYWSLRTRTSRHILLLVASYIFYMTWNPWLVTLIVGSTLLDYSVALGLEKLPTQRHRKLLLTASILGNLGILVLFKYADFFIVSLRTMLESAGIHTNLSTLSLILPVGISFYTFQTLSYTIDVYRREIPATRSLIDFALFVAFFPQLVAGPIVRASDFLPQLATVKRFNWDRLSSATVLFLIGLTKKVLIADNLATLVDPVFAQPERYVTRDLWIAMFCYGGQIFCDFSGYTDMAIAVARAMGFDLCENFRSPYLATSLPDFWRRWHISLSTWLRDYLYIPLGGSRFSRWLTYRNLMITMLLGGLWHGASWTFVVWGAIHGLALAVTKRINELRSATRVDSESVDSESADSASVKPPSVELVSVEPANSRLGVAQANSLSRVAQANSLSTARNSPLSPSNAHPLIHFGTTALGWLTTLLIVHFAWVFFRCQPMIDPITETLEPTSAALARAGYFLKHLFIPATVAEPMWLMNKAPMLLLLGLMMALQLYDESTRRGRNRLTLHAPLAGVGYALWIIALLVLAPTDIATFIYFQF